jgi:hypothetical protein
MSHKMAWVFLLFSFQSRKALHAQGDAESKLKTKHARPAGQGYRQVTRPLE